MPLYEYICKKCNEMLVEPRPADKRDDLPSCKICSDPMKRLFTSPGVAFKGSGFYTTDK